MHIGIESKVSISIIDLDFEIVISFAEFMLNHLHSNHKHRRYDGESLDMTMVVPQVKKIQNINDTLHSEFALYVP